MAISQNFISMDEVYKRTSGNKIILNHLNTMAIKDQELLTNTIMTIYDNVDVLSTVPQCDCGEIKHTYRIGIQCPTCGTICSDYTDKIDPILWLQEFTTNLKFLNPSFWLITQETIGGGKVDWLRWLCDSSFNPDEEVPTHIEGIYLDVLGSKRVYSNTMSKLRDIIVYVTNLPRPKDKGAGKASLIKLLELYDYCVSNDKLFSTYLPIVNKKLFVMENTSKGKFVNLVVSDVMDIVLTWVKTANNFELDRNLKKVNNVTAKVLSELSIFYTDFMDKYILKKTGLFRKHVFGSRGNFTFRSVVTSIPGPHDHDEVHIPWSIAVTVLRPMILNKLAKRGLAFNEMKKIITESVKMYSTLVHDILNELLEECPYKGLPIILQRN